jgi:riboflavin kinase / FMN adenylyltransferase
MNFVYLDQIQKQHISAAIALGNFDGVHVGHQEILRACIRYAKEHGLKSAAMIFDPHPSAFFKNGDFKPLMTLEKKIKRLKSLGIDFVIINKFDSEFSKISAESFIEDILVKKLEVKYLTTGYNFHFGHKRLGDVNLLSKEAKRLGFHYQKIDQVTLDYMNVSSSKIRALLSQGRISTASAMLGANVTISGKVIAGQKMAGKVLSTPTANIALNTYVCLPLFGVYVVRVHVDGTSYYGIANIGIKPTFNTSTPLLEVNIFDFDKDIYDRTLDVELLVFMRPERKFSSIDDLKWHINFDIKSAKYAVKNLDKWYRGV